YQQMQSWAAELGFQQLEVTDTDLSHIEAYFESWLARGFMGSMSYMARHGSKRTRPAELEPGTLRVISVRMNYTPPEAATPIQVLQDSSLAYLSRYALGRDYHKVMRKKLQKLADKMAAEVGEFGYRVFVDSAPVMEKPLAEKAGLGWIGKHTNLINKKAGSWFFLGEIYTDLPLPVTPSGLNQSHCGSCSACMTVCPTQAIIAPYELDARLCISYLTIEYDGFIADPLASQLGNRIYGCDDCQLVCPWNRFSKVSEEADFAVRHGLDRTALLDLYQWNEAQFLERFQGSPVRRIGYQRWLRNLTIGLANGEASGAVHAALQGRLAEAEGVLKEQIDWALAKLRLQDPV
ncbi:MAG: tRNA epoxyqueuosine(34) reductase QueG, partial [Gammaproteobacteria bacterium]|nr:tRNA epoxyqueuosine(34) reductase QueG [Gammaproteobacteria bacterium]